FFIMLSGFLLLHKEKQHGIKEFYVRRVKRITVPFIVWVSIYFWWMAFWGKYTVTVAFIISSIFSASILHLYFIPIIAELYIIAPLLWKYIFFNPRYIQYVITTFFLLLGIGCQIISQYFPWFNLEHSIFTIFIPYIGYFLVGGLVRDLKTTPIKTVFISILFASTFIITVLLRGEEVNSSAVAYLSPGIVIFSICLFVLLKKIFSLFIFLSKKTISVIRLISSTIFGIFLVHIIIRDMLGVLPIFDPYKIQSPILLFVLLYVCIVFMLSFGIVAIVRKVPYLNAIFGSL
ncbi:MAG: acyltransferase, partial [Patescibacteria group bacterium]|nr:acyltransferase [Patescibacteria group bacterium]